jgi:hypothetical protein
MSEETEVKEPEPVAQPFQIANISMKLAPNKLDAVVNFTFMNIFEVGMLIAKPVLDSFMKEYLADAMAKQAVAFVQQNGAKLHV